MYAPQTRSVDAVLSYTPGPRPILTGMSGNRGPAYRLGGLNRPILIGTIVLLHALLVWALLCGAGKTPVHHVPAEVFATLVNSSLSPANPVPTSNHKPVDVNRFKTTTPLTETPTPLPESGDVAVNALAQPLPSSDQSNTEPALPDQVTSTAAPASSTMHPRLITSGVEYLRPPRPTYPAQARRMREQGKTLLRVFVDDKGQPETAEVWESSGSSRLDDAARQAVMNALFKPFISNGVPMAVYALVPIRFKLDQ